MLWPRMQSISTHLHCFETSRSPHSIHLYLVCDGVARYKTLLKATVAGEYEAIASKSDRRRILSAIASLTDDPRPAEARALPEREHQYRIWLKLYRVIYQVDDCQKHVTVFRIAHRRRQNSPW
jgi:mRNA-degrading endonuclease RelE of RelBE toxin-antitoxin system